MKKLLVFVLTYQLVFPAPVVYSEEKSTNTQNTPPAKITCAVFEVYPEEVRPEVMDVSAENLRDELRKGGTFNVLGPVDASSALTEDPKVTEGMLTGRGLSVAYLRAKDQYYNFDFKGALRTLDTAVAEANSPEATALDRVDLMDVFLLYALLYRADRDSKKAMDYFREAARLDPDRRLSEYQYSPTTIEMFGDAKKDIASLPGGRFLVSSEPAGANIWINGTFKGVTPLVLDFFPAGRHDVILGKRGFQDFYTTVDLREELNLSGRLTAGAAKRRGNILFHEKDIVRAENQLEVASLLGKILRADKVIFLSMEDFAWNKRVYARMVDVELRASHKPAVVQVEDAKDAPFAMGVLAEALTKAAVVDLKSDLKQYADEYRPEEVILLGPRARPTIFKKPLFWVIAGAALAGIGTGVGLAVSQGGGGLAGADTTSVSVSGPVSETP